MPDGKDHTSAYTLIFTSTCHEIFPVQRLIYEYLTLPQVVTSPYTFKWADPSNPTKPQSITGMSLLIVEQLVVALEDIVSKGQGTKSVVNMSFGGRIPAHIAARQCMWISYSQPIPLSQ